MFFSGSIIVSFELLESSTSGAVSCELEDVTWLMKSLVATGDLAAHLTDLDGNPMVIDLAGFSYEVRHPAESTTGILLHSHLGRCEKSEGWVTTYFRIKLFQLIW